MNLVYQLLRLFLQFLVNTFFAKVGVRGLGNIPKGKTAVVFAGNHFNGLVDPAMVFSSATTREITMVAADYLWKYPVIGAILRGLQAIPVANRRSIELSQANTDTGTSQPGRNRHAVSAIASVLKRRSCVCLFPEGTSHSDSELKEFKTGFARAAFEAMTDDETLTEVYVVPVGLNYEQRNRFRSTCYVEFGIPVVLTRSEWLPQYNTDPQDTVHRVVELVKNRIKEITLVAPNVEHLKLAHLARKLYRERGAKESQEEFVRFTKYFIKLLSRKDRGDREIEHLYTELASFQSSLEVLGISLDELMHRDILYSQALVTAIVAPLAVPGALFHGPLAFLSRIIAHRMSEGLEDQEAHYKVLTLIFFLPVYYIVTIFALWLLFGETNAVLIMAALIGSVHFALRSRPFNFTARFFLSTLKLILFDQKRMRRQYQHLAESVQRAVKSDMSGNSDDNGPDGDSGSWEDGEHERLHRTLRPTSFIRARHNSNNVT